MLLCQFRFKWELLWQRALMWHYIESLDFFCPWEIPSDGPFSRSVADICVSCRTRSCVRARRGTWPTWCGAQWRSLWTAPSASTKRVWTWPLSTSCLRLWPWGSRGSAKSLWVQHQACVFYFFYLSNDSSDHLIVFSPSEPASHFQRRLQQWVPGVGHRNVSQTNSV